MMGCVGTVLETITGSLGFQRLVGHPWQQFGNGFGRKTGLLQIFAICGNSAMGVLVGLEAIKGRRGSKVALSHISVNCRNL